MIIIPGQGGTYRHLRSRVTGLLAESGQNITHITVVLKYAIVAARVRKASEIFLVEELALPSLDSWVLVNVCVADVAVVDQDGGDGGVDVEVVIVAARDGQVPHPAAAAGGHVAVGHCCDGSVGGAQIVAVLEGWQPWSSGRWSGPRTGDRRWSG